MSYPPPSYISLFQKLDRSITACKFEIGQLRLEIAGLNLQIGRRFDTLENDHQKVCREYEDRIVYLQNENHARTLEAEKTISTLKSQIFNMSSKYNTEVMGLMAILKLRIYEYDLHRNDAENINPQYNASSSRAQRDPRVDLHVLELQLKALPRLDLADSP